MQIIIVTIRIFIFRFCQDPTLVSDSNRISSQTIFAQTEITEYHVLSEEEQKKLTPDAVDRKSVV